MALAVESVPDPGPNEVLIRARKTLISTGTERTCLSRSFAPGTHWDHWVHYPFHPGYSMVGEVVAMGNNVRGVHEGEVFAVRERHQEYAIVATQDGILRNGHLAEPNRHFAAPPKDIYPLPANLAEDEAVWFTLATLVQNGVRRAEHKLGETVVIIGAGLLGQLVIQYMHLLGARHVIAIDRNEPRLEMARKHGATTTFAMDVAEARERILALTDNIGADVVYDVTGNARVFSVALILLRRFGRLIVLGDTGAPSAQYLTGDVVTRGLFIIGTHDSEPPAVSTDHVAWGRDRMVELFFTYLQYGAMHVSDLVTHRYSPLDAPAAYRMLTEKRDNAMGVIFDWTQLR